MMNLCMRVEDDLHAIAARNELWMVAEGDAVRVRRSTLDLGVIRMDDGFGETWILVQAVAAIHARQLAQQYEEAKMIVDLRNFGRLCALTGIES